MTQLNDILDVIQKRSLDSNLRDLVDLDNSTKYRLLLIRNNSIVEDYFKGTITKESFDTEKNRIWEGLMFFINGLRQDQLARLGGKIGFEASGHKTILYVSASPKDATPLQVGFEFDKIVAALESGAKRDDYELLRPLMAVRLEQFLIEKHKYRPYIIHFSGHGLDEGLVFSTDANQYKTVTNDILLEVFKGISDYAHCVVLNACYASAQAKTISEQGIYVIGMNAPITDAAAIFLSEKFYRALSNGQDIEDSFSQTKILLMSEYKNQLNIPELWKDGKILPAK